MTRAGDADSHLCQQVPQVSTGKVKSFKRLFEFLVEVFLLSSPPVPEIVIVLLQLPARGSLPRERTQPTRDSQSHLSPLNGPQEWAR